VEGGGFAAGTLRKICSPKISICKCDTAAAPPALRRLNSAPARAVTDLHSAFCVSYSHLLSLSLSRSLALARSLALWRRRRKAAETRAVSPVLLMIRKCRQTGGGKGRGARARVSDPGGAIVGG